MSGPRPTILLTNDDSHDSPLFHYTIETLATLGDVRIVVPAEEQSWKGKSMTRHGPLYAERVEIHGRAAWSVTGTPADCVNLGIYNLLDTRPDVVVSGINIGKNVGLAFLFASGTVGACLEANIAGVPALALSQELTAADFRQWDQDRSFHPRTTALLATLYRELIPLLWQDLIGGGHHAPTTWNVNFPYTATPHPEITRTRLGHTFYHACFSRRGDQYHHALTAATVDESPDTDDVVLRAGRVSATLVDMRTLGQAL